MRMRGVLLILIAVALVAGSMLKSNGVSAQSKPKQRSAFVVFGPTGNSSATGVGFFTITDQNRANAADLRLISRIEISGMPTGRFATHIHEGFCPPPVGP